MIRVSVFSNMELCTPEQVESMIPLVPEPRRSRALEYSHTFGQFCCLKSYLMLAELLHENFGLESFEISAGEHGKPYLAEHPDIHFSISHCRSGIAVAVSNHPIGIDIESFRKVSPSLIDRCMNAQEKASILASDNMEKEFSIYWTRKEAVFKLLGTGITDNIRDILTDKTVTSTDIDNKKGYTVSVAQSALYA